MPASHSRPLRAAALLLAAACASRPEPLSHPVAGADQVAATRAAPVTTGNVLANDSDPGGGTLEIVSFTQGASGDVTAGADGTFTWTPHASPPSGDDRFTYTIRNPQNVTATGEVTVRVAPSWSAPHAVGTIHFVPFQDAHDNLLFVADRGPGNQGLVAVRRDAAYRWYDPVRLDTGALASSYLFQAVADADGNATVVWNQETSLWWSRYTAATGTWSAAAAIDQAAPPAQGDPAAVVDAGGNVTVAWAGSPAPGRLWAARYTAATGTWSAATVIDSEAGSSAPLLAVDASGNVTATWNIATAAGYGAQGARLPAATATWEAPALLVGDTTQPSTVELLLAGGGDTAYALTRETGPAGSRLWVRVYYGGIWKAPVELGQGVGVDRMEAAIDGAGRAVVAWVQVDATSSVRQLWANSSYEWGDWQGAVRLDGAAALPGVAFPRLLLDADGNALVAWGQSTATDGRAYAARQPAGGYSWVVRQLAAEAGTAPAPTGSTCYEVVWVSRFFVDGAGNAVVLWEQCDGMVTHGWAARYDRATGLWGAGAKIEQNEQHSLRNIYGALEPSGGLTVTLRLNEGGSIDRVFATRMAPDGTWEPLVPLGSSTVSSNTPWPFVTRSGDVVAVWPSQSDARLMDLWSVRRVGGTWLPRERLIPQDPSWSDCWLGFPGPGQEYTVLCADGPAPLWVVDWR